jgi:hypothetical protein
MAKNRHAAFPGYKGYTTLISKGEPSASSLPSPLFSPCHIRDEKNSEETAIFMKADHLTIMFDC